MGGTILPRTSRTLERLRASPLTFSWGPMGGTIRRTPPPLSRPPPTPSASPLCNVHGSHPDHLDRIGTPTVSRALDGPEPTDTRGHGPNVLLLRQPHTD